MSAPATIETSIHRFRFQRGRVIFEMTPRPPREPRLARALALGHYIVELVEKGGFRDYQTITARMGVSQPRISVLVTLTLLAPEIQEAVLLGQCLVSEKDLLTVARQTDWSCQKILLRRMTQICLEGQ